MEEGDRRLLPQSLLLPNRYAWPLADAKGYLEQVSVSFGGERHGTTGTHEEVLVTNILLVPPSPDLVTAPGLGTLEFLVQNNVLFSASVAALMNRYRSMTARSRDYADPVSLVLPTPLVIHNYCEYRVRHRGAAPTRPVDEAMAVALDLLQEKGLTVDAAALRPLLRPPRLTVEF